jgi:hypothetical protein
MKQPWLVLLALLTAVGLSSCSEDFEVAAPYKNVTVIWGLLNVEDTAHYIRVQKAFLDDAKSAIDMAKTPDSNYYASLNVVLREISGSTVSTFPLTRVDLAAEGFPKEAGPFFNTPHYAYKLKRQLNAGARYRVVVTNAATGSTDSAETGLISTNRSVFDAFELNQALNPVYKVDFPKQLPANNEFVWNIFRIPSTASYFEGTIRFNYVDKNTLTNVQTDKHVDFTFASRPVQGATVKLITEHATLYSFLRESIQLPPANVERYMDSCDLTIWAGSTELYTYKLINEAQGGITGDQIKPIYTNVKGTNALGLLASRAKIMRMNVAIGSATMDSLKSNRITSPLNIRGVSDH